MAAPPIMSKRFKETTEGPLQMEILPVESLDGYYQFFNLQSDELVGMRRINRHQSMSTLTKTGISKTCRLCTEEVMFNSIKQRQEHERTKHLREHIRLNRDSPRCCFPGCPEYEQARGITKVDDDTSRKWFMSHVRDKHEIPRDVYACKLADRDTPDLKCMSVQFTTDHARRHLWKVHKIPHGNLTDEVLASSYCKVIPEELILRAIYKEKTAEIYEPDFSKRLKLGNQVTSDDEGSMNKSKKKLSTKIEEANGTLFGWKLPVDPQAHFRILPSKPETHAFEHFFTVHNELEGRRGNFLFKKESSTI